MTVCSTCHTPNEDDATTCKACGAGLAGQKFAEALAGVQDPAEQPVRPAGLLWIAVGVEMGQVVFSAVAFKPGEESFQFVVDDHDVGIGAPEQRHQMNEQS